MHDYNIDDPILPRPVVARQLGVSETTVWRLCRDGILPNPIQISARRVGWRRSTIEAFIASREAA